MKENPREVKALENTRTAVAQGWFSLMGAMVQFRKWDDILSDQLPKPAEAEASRVVSLGARRRAADKGDAVAAKIEQTEMQSAIAAHRKENKGKIRPETAGCRARIERTHRTSPKNASTRV